MQEVTKRTLGALLRVQRALAATEARTRRFQEVQVLRRRFFLVSLSRECTDACRAYGDAFLASASARLAELDKRLAMVSFAVERRLIRLVK